MESLEKIANIGKVLAEKLEKVGIHSEKELKILGSEKAFLLIKEIDSKVTLSHLYALEGAVQGIRWFNLSAEKKKQLEMFFELCR